jgi:hypothetical protein
MLCSRCVYFCACCLDHSDVIDRSSNKRTNEKTLTRPHLAKDKESGTHFSDLSVPASCATSPNMWQRQCSSFFPTSLHSSLSELRPRTFIVRARSDDSGTEAGVGRQGVPWLYCRFPSSKVGSGLAPTNLSKEESVKHLIPTPQSLKTLSAKLHAGGQALRTGSRALNAARVRISTYLGLHGVLRDFSPITISRCGILAFTNLVSRIRHNYFLINFLLCCITVSRCQQSALWISPVISDGSHRLKPWSWVRFLRDCGVEATGEKGP